MIASQTDEKRRLTMPEELPPKSAVTIHQLNEDSWIVTRQKSPADVILVALPRIDHLPADPEWEAIESRMVKHNNRKIPPFEE